MIQFLQIDQEIFPISQVTRFKQGPTGGLLVVAGGKLYQGFDVAYEKFQVRLEEALAQGAVIVTLTTENK